MNVLCMMLCIYLTLNQIVKQCKRPALATSDQQCYLYKRYCKRPAVLNRKQCKRPAMATSDQHWLQATSNAIYIKDTASDQQGLQATSTGYKRPAMLSI